MAARRRPHAVGLDQVIKAIRETGADMKVKYRESGQDTPSVEVIARAGNTSLPE